MGERKVINKYIPADFDPALVPRGKKLSSKDGTVPVRMMLPFSMQCQTCHTFLYRGRKFNSKKEPVAGPSGKYLGIQRFRFYIKCNHCSRPISFLTDPENCDYEMENGATRNFEMHRNNKKEVQEDEADEAQQAKEDPMKALENRVLHSQREIADLDNLEEIKSMNARHLRIDPLDALQLEEIPNDDALLTEEDEALIKSIRFGAKPKEPEIKRLTEEDERRLDEERQARLLNHRQQDGPAKKKASTIPALVKKKKRRIQEPKKKDPESGQAKSAAADSGGLSSLLGGYGSDSDSN